MLTFADELKILVNGNVVKTVKRGENEYSVLVDTISKIRSAAWMFAHFGIPVTGIIMHGDSIRPMH